ncbi:hypothetical protein NL676_032119 [Syzygium grande]|nr:hypothetical protein NL676_032119 [Syzygium grande]
MVSASPPSQDAASYGKRKEEGDPSRRAKWWYSTFHTVTAMIGASGPGVMMLILSWCMTLKTMWQMVQFHECVPGTWFDCYVDLGQHAFGQRLGLWIVLPIVYMVIGGKRLKKFMEIICTDCPRIRQSYWICIFRSVHFFLSQLPNISFVTGVSLATGCHVSQVQKLQLCSSAYSTIAWAGSLAHGRVPDVSYAYRSAGSADYVFRVFNALGQISSAFAGHAVVLEIQATIPSTPETPSKVLMWKGVVGAYLVNAVCYFPVALIGYWAFGQDVEDNVLIALRRPSWLIASANLMVVVHVIGGFQVYAMPVFDMLESTMVKRVNFPPGRALRLLARSAYVALTLFIGVTFPFFGDLLGFFGGFGFAPTSYFLPSIMWLVVKKPRKFSINWFVNWAPIIIGVFIMMASTIGGLRNIIADTSTYHFYT